MTIQRQTSIDFLNVSRARANPDLVLFTGGCQAAKLSEMDSPEFCFDPKDNNSPQANKFVAGWDCLRLDAQDDPYDPQVRLFETENQIKPKNNESPERNFFFAASNPIDNNEIALKIDEFYKKTAVSSSFAGQEIASESVSQSIKTSRQLDTVVKHSVLSENQKFCIDPKLGKDYLIFMRETDSMKAFCLVAKILTCSCQVMLRGIVIH